MRMRILGAAVAAVLAGSAPSEADLTSNLSTLAPDQAAGYLGPFVSGLSATMNSGVYRGGDIPLAGLSVRLDLQASYISFSDDARTYRAAAFSGYPEADVPTVIGDPNGAVVTNTTNGSLTFQHPGGFDVANFGLPVPQLTIGNVVGTRLMGRYAKVNFSEGAIDKVELWGIGAQHSLSQWFSGLPVSVAVGAMIQSVQVGEDDLVKADMYSLNVTGSKRYGTGITLEPYVGLGIDSLKMESNYESGSEQFKVDFDRANDFRGTLGLNLAMPVVSAHIEGYLAAENGIAGSISVGI
jgi:hypothetical protein